MIVWVPQCKRVVLLSFSLLKALRPPKAVELTEDVLCMQVARLLGYECERINFSASTTVEQLYGSFVPRMVANRREFSWQDGKLVQAVKQGKWLLFDEINLAPPEVLGRLAMLLAGGELTVPGSGERLDKALIRGTRMFATMNPASVGGGRGRLPRAVKSMFTTVHLVEYVSQELHMIMNDLFAKAKQVGLVTQQHIDSMFSFHQAVQEKLNSRQIGKVGGPYEINLRDMTKVKDILEATMQEHLCHYGFIIGHSQSGQLIKQPNYEQIAVSAICQYLQLTYAHRFHAAADQEVVCQLIAQRFPAGSERLDSSLSIDAAVSLYARIGSVYLSKAEEPESSKPAVHTPLTIKQLELLAVACKSRRAVLLEGDTCSRKTLLVQELARLACQKLIVIPLNQDTDASSLIGQFVPEKVRVFCHPNHKLQCQTAARMSNFTWFCFLPHHCHVENA